MDPADHPDPHPRHLRPGAAGRRAAAGRPGRAGRSKFGAYRTELDDLRQAREPFDGLIADVAADREASVMDTADDIAYAIHDLEDFYRVGVLQQGTVAAELMAWQRERGRPARRWTDAELRPRRPPAGARRSSGCAAHCTARTAGSATTTRSPPPWSTSAQELVDGLLALPFDGSIEAEQCVGAVLGALDPPAHRRDHGDRRSRRCAPATCVLGPAQWHEVQVLKFVHHRFVLARPDLALHQRGQARLLGTLVEALLRVAGRPGRRGPGCRAGCTTWSELRRGGADRAIRPGPDRPGPAAGRSSTSSPQLTDGQAVAMLDALSGRSGALWTDAFVL